VSGIAHEINNPVNAILLNVTLLQDIWHDIRPLLEVYGADLPPGTLGGLPHDEAVAAGGDLLAAIHSGANRIQSLVADLKGYARPPGTDRRERFDLAEVVRSAIRLLANVIRNTTSSFSLQLADALPPVSGHFQHLEQVVVNLIQNACQALPDRGRGIVVSVRQSEDPAWVELAVADEGCGVAPENLARLASPFFTTKRDEGGLGLGLSISRRIVRDHGGTLTFAARTSPGGGMVVTVRLPVAGPTGEAP
jgi:two-component system, NtrC family, sensor kinase